MSSSPERRKHPVSPGQATFLEAMRKGAELLQLGKARDALPYLQQAYRLDSEDVDAAINLGGAYVMLNKPKQAVPILEKAVELEPENSKTWINLGAAYLGNPILANREKQQRAIEAFEKALELDPTAPSVHYNLGLIYRDQGNLQVAVEQFRRAAAVNPLDDDARKLLEKLSQRLGSQDLEGRKSHG